MKYLKIGLLIITSLCVGIFPVQALTEEEIIELQGQGDLYGLVNYKEELPTETTPYRITMLTPFEKYPSEIYQSYIKISEEEYNNLKSYQEIMNRHQEQYYSIFEPLWAQSLEIQVQIKSKSDEYEKLEESLQQETEEERKKQIQEQMDQIEVEVERLYSERETISLQIT